MAKLRKKLNLEVLEDRLVPTLWGVAWPNPGHLTLSFVPQMPSIPADTPLGTTVATVTATWSDGSPFTGTLGFATPYLDDGGTFALSCTACATANLVVNPLGRGVSGDGGSVQKVTVEAVQ